MNIVLPEPIESRLTPGQAALHLAIGLFSAGEVTLAQYLDTIEILRRT